MKTNQLPLLIITLLSTFHLTAATKYWTNANGTNRWHDAGNWTPAGVPTSSDDVHFNPAYSTDDCTIDADVTIKWVGLLAGYTGTVTQTNSVKVTSNNFSIRDGVWDIQNGNFHCNGNGNIQGGTITKTQGRFRCLWMDIYSGNFYGGTSGIVYFDDNYNGWGSYPAGKLHIHGGTVDFGGSYAYIYGWYIQEGGNFVASSSATILGRYYHNCSPGVPTTVAPHPFTIFTKKGGTFDHNNGLFYFRAYSRDSWTNAYIWLGDATFYDAQFWGYTNYSGNNQDYLFHDKDTVYVENNLIHSAAAIDATIAFKGDLTIYSNARDVGKGSYYMYGNNNQHYNHYGSSRGKPLVVDKTGGTVSPLDSTLPSLFVQRFDLRNGHFISSGSNGEFSVGGSFGDNNTEFFTIRAGTTFDPNGGTVRFRPSVNYDRIASVRHNGVTFNNVIVDVRPNHGNVPRFQTNDGNLIVGNNFTHADGNMTTNVDLFGNFYVGPNADLSTGWVRFLDTDDQYYGLIGAAASSCAVLVSKTAGKVLPDSTANGFRMSRLTLINGEFVAPVGTLQINHYNTGSSDIFNHNGGTFTANGGTVLFNPNYHNRFDGRLFDIHVQPATEFHNVVLDMNRSDSREATIRMQGGPLIAHGNVTLQDGVFEGDIQVGGNVDFSNANTLSYTGSVDFIDGNPQTYHFGNSLAGELKYIDVHKTGGVVAGDVANTAISAWNIRAYSGTFELPSGTLTLGENLNSGAIYNSLYTTASGAITHNGSGKVICKGSRDIQFTANGSISVFDLEIDKGGKQVHLINGDLNVANELKLVGSPSFYVFDNTVSTMDLVLNGTMFFEDNGSLVQAQGGVLSGSGKIDYQRMGIAQNTAFNLWSSPIVDADLFEVFENSNNCVLYGFDQTQQLWRFDLQPGQPLDCPGFPTMNATWSMGPGSGYTVDGLMDPGMGYVATGSTLANDSIRTFVGEPNNGPIAVPVKTTSVVHTVWVGSDWSLVGNPYPSAIGMNEFWQENAIANPRIKGGLYFLVDRPGQNIHQFDDYAVYNSIGFLDPANTPGIGDNGNIGASQGFWVDANADGTVLFDNYMRKGTNDVFYKRGNIGGNNPDARVWISLKHPTFTSNQILTGMKADATMGMDGPYDARQAYGAALPPVALFSMVDSVPCVIQGIPTVQQGKRTTVPLYVHTVFDGLFEFQVNRIEDFQGHKLYLEDRVKGTFNEISPGSTYPLRMMSGDYEGRFFLVFEGNGYNDDGTVKNIADEQDISNPSFISMAFGLSAYNDHDFLIIDATTSGQDLKKVEVFDLSGRRLYINDGLSINMLEIPTADFSNGIYLVRAEMSDGQMFTERIPLLK